MGTVPSTGSWGNSLCVKTVNGCNTADHTPQALAVGTWPFRFDLQAGSWSRASEKCPLQPFWKSSHLFAHFSDLFFVKFSVFLTAGSRPQKTSQPWTEAFSNSTPDLCVTKSAPFRSSACLLCLFFKTLWADWRILLVYSARQTPLTRIYFCSEMREESQIERKTKSCVLLLLAH